MKNTLKRNYIYNTTYQLLAIIIPLITTPYVTRVLGASRLGEYYYAYSIAYYFILFILLGINSYGAREIAYCRGKGGDISALFWELYSFQFSMGVFISLLYFLFVLFLWDYSFSLFAMVLPVSTTMINITWLYSGLEEFKYTAMRDSLIKIGTTLFIFLLVKSETDYNVYVLIQVMGMGLSQLILWLNIKKYVVWIKPSLKGVLSHIKGNLILFIPTIAVSVYKIMDKIMLGQLCKVEEVGFYQCGENIVQIPMILVISLGTIMQPKMANLYAKKSTGGSERIISYSFLFAMMVSSLLCFGIMSVASEFVPLYFGAGYEKCIYLFHIMLPTCIFISFANVIRTQLLIPLKRDKEYIISLILGATINLMLNLKFIPMFQSVGAAWGTLFAEMVVCCIQCFFVIKIIDLKRVAVICGPGLIASMLMYLIWRNICVELSWLWLFIKIICAGVTYAMILIACISIMLLLGKANNIINDIVMEILKKLRKNK